MDVYELLIKSLEDAEFDIYHAADTATVEDARRKALADIHGGEVSRILSQTEVESWKKCIENVATFRRASLEWREEP